MESIFKDKASTPSAAELKTALGSLYTVWQKLCQYTKDIYPASLEEWNFASQKFGWSFRIKDKKRVIVYLLPRDKFFKVALVFGQKATDVILKSDVDENIKTAIREARVYAEGRGIRIDVKDKSITDDLKKLISVKINN